MACLRTNVTTTAQVFVKLTCFSCLEYWIFNICSDCFSSSSKCHFSMSDSIVSTFLERKRTRRRCRRKKGDFGCLKIKYLSLLEAATAGGTINCSRELDINGNLTICINNFLHNDLSKVDTELFSLNSRCAQQKGRLISNDNKSRSICRENGNSVEISSPNENRLTCESGFRFH